LLHRTGAHAAWTAVLTSRSALSFEGMAARIHMPEEALAAFCRKHRVRKLALFGSVLRDDFRPDSDVDVLVEFEPGARAGFLKLAAMELELGSMIGRKIDLRTPGELSRYFRDEVLASAEVQFAT
jgi:predicted nucleotidyltransferase